MGQYLEVDEFRTRRDGSQVSQFTKKNSFNKITDTISPFGHGDDPLVQKKKKKNQYAGYF